MRQGGTLWLLRKRFGDGLLAIDLHGHEQCAEDAAAVVETGRDDVVVDAVFDLMACDVAAEPVSGARADRRKQACMLHDAAAEDDPLRRDRQRDLGAELAEVVGFDVPDRMVRRGVAEFVTEPRDVRGAVGQTFETITVMQAYACEAELVVIPVVAQRSAL